MMCERCGANLALVGKMHRCVPRQVDGVPILAQQPPVTHKQQQAVTHASSSVTHTDSRRSKGAERQARYRAKDPHAYRQRHRDYMRRRRATAR